MLRPCELTAVFRHFSGLDVTTMLGELHDLVPDVLACSPMPDGWLLKGNTKSEPLLYDVFDPVGPTTSAIAVLTESLKHDVDPCIVSMWNGREGSESASVQYIGRPAPEQARWISERPPVMDAVAEESMRGRVLNFER